MKIRNLKEKRLLISRLLIREQLEPTDKNITDLLCRLFPADKPNLDEELIEWIRKYVNSNDIKSCDIQLASVRRKGENNLKIKGQYVGYGAKLVKSPKNALATYNIFTKGKKYSGNYSGLSRRIGRLPKVEK